MKIKLLKAWRNSRTGERFAAGTEVEIADAQAQKLIDAGYAIAVPNQTTETTVTNENAGGETTPPIPDSPGVNPETTTVEFETVSTETEPENSPPTAEPVPDVPTEDDDESRRMRRRREAYEAN